METVYMLIIGLALYAFCSNRINTETVVKKLWLLLVILGACIDLSQIGRAVEIPNYFIEAGLLVYLSAEAHRALTNKRNRRATDTERRHNEVEA